MIMNIFNLFRKKTKQGLKRIIDAEAHGLDPMFEDAARLVVMQMSYYSEANLQKQLVFTDYSDYCPFDIAAFSYQEGVAKWKGFSIVTINGNVFHTYIDMKIFELFTICPPLSECKFGIGGAKAVPENYSYFYMYPSFKIKAIKFPQFISDKKDYGEFLSEMVPQIMDENNCLLFDTNLYKEDFSSILVGRFIRVNSTNWRYEPEWEAIDFRDYVNNRCSDGVNDC